MTQTTIGQRFDFSQPSGLASELADRWTSWMDAVRNLFKERWAQYSSHEIEFSAANNLVLSFGVARSRLPKTSAAYYVTMGDPPMQNLLVMGRPTALGLVLLSLGVELNELPPDRELSSIESTVLGLLTNQLIKVIGDSWPKKDPLFFQLGEPEWMAHRSRLFAPEKVVLLVNLNVTIAQQQQPLFWIIPYAELESLLWSLNETQRSPVDKRKMEQRAHDIPVQMAVGLGQASVSMTELSSLERGDLIVLTQKISEPLPVMVAGQLKFLAWPGRKGNRGAIKISQVI